MNPRHPDVSKRAGEKCEYCKAPQRLFNMLFEVEHVVPVAAWSDERSENLALACRRCNLHKVVRPPVTAQNTPDDNLIFNPRIQRWDEHFELNLQTGEIVGRTPTGTATVKLLRMNSPPAPQARLLWIEFAIFP